jgi:hypothetical protein
MLVEDGPSCPGCGLPNYEGLCPVCRGDEPAYMEELRPFFGEFYPGQDASFAAPAEEPPCG